MKEIIMAACGKDCSACPANIMNAIIKAKILKKVTGYGAGRYVFIEL